MSNALDRKMKPKSTEDETIIMKRYGITKVASSYFYYGPYRYTDLRDAVAQSRRAQAKSNRNAEPA